MRHIPVITLTLAKTIEPEISHFAGFFLLLTSSYVAVANIPVAASS
jgi:hypothetical protein